MAAAAIPILASAVRAEGGAAFGTVGGWSVERSGGSCTLSAPFTSYRGGNITLLSVSFDDRTEAAIVSFNDPTVKSLKNSESKTIKMIFVKNGVLDDGWGESDFTVRAYDDGTFFAKKFTEQLLTDFAESTRIAFFYKDVLLQSYGLERSREGIGLLRKCAADESRINPTDPFE